MPNPNNEKTRFQLNRDGVNGDGINGDENTDPNLLTDQEKNTEDLLKFEPYKPNEENKSNTGGGVEAAVGTDYSWNKQATEMAKKAEQSEVLEVKQNYLNNRQQMETNALNYQTEADMMKYQANQNVDKVGWTGGYVLDQNRQMEYLKASIQAQMYGAMELQKYGYDSALAAARLSYDLNQMQYAHQYYQEAVQNALNEAATTGVYFSAEVRDMMSQRAVAQQKLDALEGKSDDELTDEERKEKEQAQNLIKQIGNWFSENQISEAGVKTLEAWIQEQSMALSWNDENYRQYYAALQATVEKVNENATMFLKYTIDENGNPKLDWSEGYTGEIGTIDMSTATVTELINYVKQTYTNASGEEVEMINTKAREQVQTYLNYLYNDALNQASVTETDSNGNTKKVTNKNKTEYVEAINKLQELINKLNEACGEGTFTNPIPTNDQKPNNGGEATGHNETGDYKSTGEWNNQSSILLIGDNGSKAFTLSNLQYMDWEQGKRVKLTDETAERFAKASLEMNIDDLPEGWAKVLKDRLGISGTFLLETLPTTAEYGDAGTYYAIKNIGGVQSGIEKDSDTSYVYMSDGKNGLGGLIEGFLKEFYEKTTGTAIKQGSMLAIGNSVLIWNGDNGDPRWIIVKYGKELIDL